MMKRHALLLTVMLTVSSIAAAQQHVPAARAAAPIHGSSEWGYVGPTGPAHWAELSKDYDICAHGQQESPINVEGAIGASLGILATNWRPLPLRVVDTGHALQIDAPAGSSMTLSGKTYDLVQFHFHHPSEHLLNGRRFPLEVHFVHRRPDGVLGVVAVFVNEGRANPQLQRILDARPAEHGQINAVAGQMLNPAGLMPGGPFVRYEGSLTTPPCSENVDWAVMETPIQASAAQIKGFEQVYAANARPLQALSRRFLLRSR